MKYILSSSKQRSYFYGIEEERNIGKLMLLLDCRTRWNSTFLMIRRALRLRNVINEYVKCSSAASIRHFTLTEEEWRQLEYLCDLLAPFYIMTTTLSKLDGPAVHQVFDVYDTLFDHIEYSNDKLHRKTIDWKLQIRTGLENAHNKLREYYSKTYKSEGYVYAIATILNPQSKLEQFKKASWIEDDEDWVNIYHQVFINVFKHYQTSNPNISVQTTRSVHISEVNQAGNRIRHVRKRRRVSGSNISPDVEEFGEVEKYLGEREYLIFIKYLYHVLQSNPLTISIIETTKSSITAYWQAHRCEFPILYLMAQDFLAIPASGVGVERLFNSARDICSYRRGRLEADTIHGLMLQLTTDRFLIKQEYQRMRDSMEPGTDPEYESDSEDMEECVYISDADEHENGDEEDDSGEEETVLAVSQPQRPRRVQKRPGQYRDLANGSV